MIRQLQARTLELQERLAVALDVDQAKDEAIKRFHNTLENVAVKLQTLNNEKTRIEREMDKISEQNKRDLEEATYVCFLNHINLMFFTCSNTKIIVFEYIPISLVKIFLSL